MNASSKWFCLAVLLLSSSSAFAKHEYYYLIAESDSHADGVRYTSPDAACMVLNPKLQVELIGYGASEPQPYESPVIIQETPPDFVRYECTATSLVVNDDGTRYPIGISGLIDRHGDNCEDEDFYNPSTGACESLDNDQDRKEAGDVDSTRAGVVICKKVGDPINLASGNLFESEIDYRDTDGEIEFTRSYNSNSGYWTYSYNPYLIIGASSLALFFDDGHASIFIVDNVTATAEPSEMGSMERVDGLWVYTSPDNRKMMFDEYGALAGIQQRSGLVQTVSHDYGATSATTTVTDSRGHTLAYSEAYDGSSSTLSVGDLMASYIWNSIPLSAPPYSILQLQSVARTRGGHTATRTYAYEDTRNPALLTGITDERGVRYTSWTYDGQGRATSSQHPGEVDLTSLSYDGDSTTTVTNALGHAVAYHYEVIQGAKRITSIDGEPAAGCPASNSSYTYTGRGQVATRTDALNHVTAYTYDTQGREITRVEAQGTPQERTVTTTWDQLWRSLPETVTTPDHITTYTYDSEGRLLSTSEHDSKEATP